MLIEIRIWILKLKIMIQVLTVKVGYHVKILKYKNIFLKGDTKNWSEQVFLIKILKKYCTADICNSRKCPWRKSYWKVL